MATNSLVASHHCSSCPGGPVQLLYGLHCIVQMVLQPANLEQYAWTGTVPSQRLPGSLHRLHMHMAYICCTVFAVDSSVRALQQQQLVPCRPFDLASEITCTQEHEGGCLGKFPLTWQPPRQQSWQASRKHNGNQSPRICLTILPSLGAQHNGDGSLLVTRSKSMGPSLFEGFKRSSDREALVEWRRLQSQSPGRQLPPHTVRIQRMRCTYCTS